MHAAVLNIRPSDILAHLYEIRAELISSYTITSQIYDIDNGMEFIPPIYRSVQFTKLFQALTELTASKISLRRQNMILVITKHKTRSCICLRSVINSGVNINIPLIDWQYQKMVEVLKAGGMTEISHYDQQVKMYYYSKLNTAYSIFKSSTMPPFLYINTEGEESVIQALACLNISMDKATNYSLKEIYEYYNIPICNN